MEVVGWATAAVGALGGCVLVVGYVLDQVPALAEKAGVAIASVRRLRTLWRGEVDQVASRGEKLPVAGDEGEKTGPG